MSSEKIALVGTPCQILAATKINKYEDYTGGSDIDFKLGLFCMENFSYSYLEKFLEERGIKLFEVKEFRIDKGYFIAFLMDGSTFKIPIAETELFTRKNCHVCTDFTSDASDISVGSVGTPEDHSTVIVRTKKGKEVIDNCIKKGYIQAEKLDEKGEKILRSVANKKISGNSKIIAKREAVARPVLSKRYMSDDEVKAEALICQFKNLENDVISVGSCVLCGACEYVCPIDSIQINRRKPVATKECEDDCHACYFACPRTYVSEEIFDKDIDEKPLGDYIELLSVKAESIIGQDGGVVSAILIYLLENEIVDEVSIVRQDKDAPWRPQSFLTSRVQDVVSAAGTKYSTVPIGFKALSDK
ncbi:MAG: Coenzyme F420 hydrogenase/dehydrogenase, beta subunit C-terminal domain [Methanobrevibacter sp.]|uniref:Coenzyme F420 hydrogenase/dehydrogenase, beta subunit C-terminal domain n=1 Tax=Methanobrevibacter sp. TaxID=66852 RepID=UPI0026DEB84A|nr:Coenzyme F420 hydrogenase/dehydrogenase, beta subunit C-terminal domain [Methanobrevibacter sp.]MDO5849204.1 Coenzyme F420 hydrogenase/dehydrogenase, beta subunit C-terminal domain [Methanobrevibacter sp.]